MEKSKLLIHTCCAICGANLFETLHRDYEITVLFHGSNIHPKDEYEKRKESVKKLANIYNLELIEEEYMPNKWIEYIKGLEKEPEGGKRCSNCFEFLLQRTIEVAEANNIKYFTTTLNTSPYKDSDKIKLIGHRLGHGRTQYLSMEDLKINKKDNWPKTRQLAREYNFYHQKYCGCCFSKTN